MNIKLKKRTIIEGEMIEAGEEIEVSTPIAKMLIASNKAESLETVELKLEVSMTPELEAKIKEVQEQYENEINTLKEQVANREAEYAALYSDIFTLSLKELREKYANQIKE